MARNLLAIAMSTIAATLLASSAMAQTDGRDCGGEIACPLTVEGQPERQYYVALPADIDDRAAVPVMI